MSSWGRWAEVVVVSVLAAPFAAAFAVWLAGRRRRAGMDAGWSTRSALAEVLIVVGTAPWLWMVMTPNPGHPRGYNLVPLRDLTDQVHVGFLFAVTQVTGNLLVFAALGFGLMIRFRLRPIHVLVIGAIGSVAIETMQWTLNLGRFSSVDDVLVNATGAYLFAWLAHPWWHRPAESRSVGGELSGIELDVERVGDRD